MRKRVGTVVIIILIISVLVVMAFLWVFTIQRSKYPTLTFIGHASVKLRSTDGTVIYIDPYFPVGDYREPADIILVTHGHSDHNAVQLCKQAKDCKIIRWSDAVIDGEYKTFDIGKIHIEAVPSGGNSNHNIRSNAGYIVTLDGVSVFHAGDTSMNEKTNEIVGKKIDYAMYPIDGRYNMGPDEASEMANMIGATHNIPIHGDSKKWKKQRKTFWADNKLSLTWGQTILLKGDQ